MQVTQKNINYGTITAGGNVHIGDTIYVIEHDFPVSILFLRIEAGASGYEAMLSVKSLDDQSVSLLRETVQLTISDDLFDQVAEFQSLRRGTDAPMRRSGFAGRSPESWESVLTETLHQTFFSGDIGTVCRDFLDLLQTAKINELLLVVSTEDERIQNLPWEMALPKLTPGGGSDLPRNNFGLIRSRERTLERFNRQGPTVETAPLKMLFIPALPEDLAEGSKLLEIENEQRKIIEAVRVLEATGTQQSKLVMEILDCANLEEIKEALEKRSHDIVHISGHGAYVDAVKAGVLYLENEDGDEQQTTGEELGRALRQFSSIKLLVLSACETAVGGPVGSTAEQMAAVGLPAVLAMRFSVTDDGARLFTETLYTRLAFGDPLTKAMHDARLSLWNYVQKRRTDAPQVFTPAEWFTPVLYQNQAIGPLLKPGPYNHDTLGRFYPQTPFLAGKHTRLIGEGFIGRKRLLIRLRQCFKRGEHVCLHGLGGLGKTTTAEAFADSYRKRNGYDILILRGSSQIQEAVILEQIFVRWKFETQPDEFRANQLRFLLDDPNQSPTGKLQLILDNCLKERSTILIFDNFEDVQINSDGTQQQSIGSEGLRAFLRYLLENAPRICHVLFTTRYQIADLTDLLTDLAIDKMIYAEQYRYINFSETLCKLAAPERAILDRQIDGHPRALELLEGNLRKTPTFDLTEFDKEVADVETKIFEDLLLNRLYAQLTELERGVFTAASIFFNRSPVVALGFSLNKPVETLMPILAVLRDWSLCFWDEHKQVFEIHTLTRAWMRKQEQPNQEQYKAISHQVGIFFGFLQEQLTTKDGFTAIRYFEQAEAWKDYATIAFRLENHFRLTGLYNTALNLNQDILTKDISPKVNATALNSLGLVDLNTGKYPTALYYFEQSLTINRQIGDRDGESANISNIGLLYSRLDDYKAALQYSKQSLIIKQQLGDRNGESTSLTNISNIYDAQGERDTALQYLKQSLTISQETGDRHGEGITLGNIGQNHLAQGNYATALQHLEQSLNIIRQFGDRTGEGAILNNISQVYAAQGKQDMALQYLKQSLTMLQKIGDRHGEGITLSNLANMVCSQGALSTALEYWGQSLIIFQQIGNRKAESITLGNIINFYIAQGDFDTVQPYLERSLTVNQYIGNRIGETHDLYNIGQIYKIKGNNEMALHYFQQCKAIKRQIGDQTGESTILREIAQICKMQGEYETALRYLAQSLTINQQISDRDGESITLNNIGQIYRTCGAYETALRYFEQSLIISQQIGNQSNIAATLSNMGSTYFDNRQDANKAVPLLIQAYTLFKQIGSPNASVPESSLNAIIEQIGEERFTQILQSNKNNP